MSTNSESQLEARIKPEIYVIQLPTAFQLKAWSQWVTSGKNIVSWPRRAGKSWFINYLLEGQKLIYGSNGRLKPLANVIFNRAMKRMSTDDPVEIVRDLESQIKLLNKDKLYCIEHDPKNHYIKVSHIGEEVTLRPVNGGPLKVINGSFVSEVRSK